MVNHHIINLDTRHNTTLSEAHALSTNHKYKISCVIFALLLLSSFQWSTAQCVDTASDDTVIEVLDNTFGNLFVGVLILTVVVLGFITVYQHYKIQGVDPQILTPPPAVPSDPHFYSPLESSDFEAFMLTSYLGYSIVILLTLYLLFSYIRDVSPLFKQILLPLTVIALLTSLFPFLIAILAIGSFLLSIPFYTTFTFNLPFVPAILEQLVVFLARYNVITRARLLVLNCFFSDDRQFFLIFTLSYGLSTLNLFFTRYIFLSAVFVVIVFQLIYYLYLRAFRSLITLKY